MRPQVGENCVKDTKEEEAVNISPKLRTMFGCDGSRFCVSSHAPYHIQFTVVEVEVNYS